MVVLPYALIAASVSAFIPIWIILSMNTKNGRNRTAVPMNSLQNSVCPAKQTWWEARYFLD